VSRFGNGGSSGSGGESAPTKGSIKLVWSCWYVTLFGVLAASVKKGARTSLRGTGFRLTEVDGEAEALSSSESQISLR